MNMCCHYTRDLDIPGLLDEYAAESGIFRPRIGTSLHRRDRCEGSPRRPSRRAFRLAAAHRSRLLPEQTQRHRHPRGTPVTPAAIVETRDPNHLSTRPSRAGASTPIRTKSPGPQGHPHCPHNAWPMIGKAARRGLSSRSLPDAQFAAMRNLIDLVRVAAAAAHPRRRGPPPAAAAAAARRQRRQRRRQRGRGRGADGPHSC
ncbi:hypothetical protein GGR56DRAFT_378826 [Xylariaceae sp. FL0804]|nr:hypothetical protein GGR56DRAFT_378826 [Xylariaceae sp. FL0804]